MGKLRRLIASTSVVAILSTLVVSSSAYAALDASKGVKADHWAYSSVEALVGSEAVNATGAFNGDSNVIRADFAKMLQLHLGLEGDAKGSDVFDDVVADSYYDGPVGVLNAVGAVSGDAGTKNFRPSDKINRAEVAKIVVKANDLPAVDKAGADLFSDVKASDWFNDEVGTAYCYGILKGYADGTFGGGKNATRYEAAKMVAVEPELIDDCAAADDTPADDTPADDTPADDTPADDTPADDDTVTEGDLTITLSDSTPAATTLGDGTAYNGVLSFTATAGAEGSSIQGVTLQKSGLTTDSNVSGVSVWVGNTRYGNIVSVSEAVATITFASNPILIPANGSVDVDVKINLDAAAGSGTVQFGLKSVDAGAGTASGVDTVVWGETFGTVDGATSVGTLVIDSETYSTATRNVKMGTEKQPIAKFTFAGGANEKLEILEIRFRNNGNSSDGDVTNIALVDQANAAVDLQVVAEGTTDKAVVFDFRDSPLPIDKGETKTYLVQGDVVSGSTRTTQFLIDNDYDVIVNGLTTSSGILATAGVNEASFPIGDRASSAVYNQVTGEEGSLSISKDASSKSGNIGVGGKQVPVGTWKFEATGEDIEVRKIAFDLDNGDLGSLATVTNITGTVKLVKDYGTENEATVYSIAASDVDLHDDVLTANADEQFTLATYFTVPAGETATVTVVVDVLSTAASSLTMQATMANVYYKRLSSGTYNTAITTEVVANTLTSIAATVSLSSSASMGNGTVVAGGNNVKVGSFTLQAGSAEGISVQTIILDVTVDATVTLITEVTNLKLKVGATQIGSTVTSPAATDNSFNVSGALPIPESGNVTIDVYADISTSAGSATANGSILTLVQAATDITYVGNVSQTSASTGIAATNFQTLTVRAGGTLEVTPGTQAASGVMHSAEAGREILAFKMSAVYEDIKVTQLLFETTDGGSNLKNITLKDSLGAPIKTGGTVVSDNITLSGLNITVPKDGVLTYKLYADSEASGTIKSAETVNIRLGSVDATGVNSGSTITETAVTSELGATSSLGHYKVGDLLLESTDAAVTADPYFMVSTAAANEGANLVATGITMVGSEAAAAANTVAATERFAKFPGVLEVCVISTSNCTNNLTEGAPIWLYDVSTTANTGFFLVDTALSNINAADVLSGFGLGASGTDLTADVTLAAADVIVMFKTTLYTANNNPNTANGAFAVGDVAAIVDSSTVGNNGFYQTHTVMAVDSMNGAGTMDLTGEADISGVTIADANDMVTKLNTISAEEITTINTTTATYEYRPGEIVFVSLGTDDAANGFEWVVVESHVRPGTVWAAGSLSSQVALANGSIITKVFEDTLVDGNIVSIHDSEPVITKSATALADGTGISGANQEVARYNVKSDGDRTIYLESVTVICTGSYVTNTEFNDNAMEVWVNGVRRFNDAENSANCDDTTAGSKGRIADFASPIEISAGTTTELIFKYDTSATAGQASGESIVFKIDGVAGELPVANDAVDWYYTAADPSPGTEPTESSPTTVSDSYPVSGPTLTY